MAKNKKDFTTGKEADIPGRFETTGSDAKEEKGLKTPDPTGTELKEVDVPKAAINTDKAASVVAAGMDSGVGSSAFSGRAGIVFGGGAGAIGGDLSATTNAHDAYRSGSRAGRTRDSMTRKLDLFTTEIVTEAVSQSKPLDETSEHQGYNGQYLNEHAKAQRSNGGSPADPLFMRSLDELSMDMIYYSEGQHVTRGDEQSENLGIHTYDVTTNAYSDDVENICTGSYMADALTINLDLATRRLTSIAITAEDISARGADETVMRAANDSALRYNNISELDRTRMIDVAGNETQEGWSPLGMAIPFASGQNRFLSAFDQSVGDVVYTSARKLSTALAYQINKTAKDGSKAATPMAEMCNGLVNTLVDNVGAVDSFEGDAFQCVFRNSEVLLNGGAGLFLAINDSLTKYNTKGKILSLPLSFKSALSSCLSTCKPLKMHAQLEQLMIKNELFSTIDGPYDGVKPIVITDKAKVVTPVDVFRLGGTNSDFNIYTMHYENLRNRYNINVYNYLLSGIHRYLNERAGRLCDALTNREVTPAIEGTTATIRIPVVSSTTCVSLWDLLVCASTPYIVEDRIIALQAVLSYEDDHGYPYSTAQGLPDQVVAAENFSFLDTEQPLVTAIAKPVASMKVIMPELFWPVTKTHEETVNETGCTGALTVLPHYFVQNQFEADEHGHLTLSDDYSTMAYPSTRSGSKFSFMDTIYGMTEADYRLSLDRMVTYPCYQAGKGISGHFNDDDEFVELNAVYKYGLTGDGIPAISYAAYMDNSANAADGFTIRDLLITPRELGLCQVAPAGMMTPVRRLVGSHAGHTIGLGSSYLGLSGPGFYATIYRGHGTNAPTADILGEGTTNMDYQASLRGDYVRISCTQVDREFNQGWIFNANTAFNYDDDVPFTAGGFGHGYDDTQGVYHEHEGISDVIPAGTRSMHRYFWNRIQRLPFAVNPFDVNTNNLAAHGGNNYTRINEYDPYDFLYILGLCGFRASDYSELAFSRQKQRISLGMGYISDPFVEQSMLLR